MRAVVACITIRDNRFYYDISNPEVFDYFPIISFNQLSMLVGNYKHLAPTRLSSQSSGKQLHNVTLCRPLLACKSSIKHSRK